MTDPVDATATEAAPEHPGRAVARRLGRMGVWTFELDKLSAADEREFVREVERLGYPALWVPESVVSKESRSASMSGSTSQTMSPTGARFVRSTGSKRPTANLPGSSPVRETASTARIHRSPTDESVGGRPSTRATTNRGGAGTMAGLRPIEDKNLDGYGAPIIPWDKARQLLETTWKQQGADTGGLGTHWVATVDPDGKPHVVPVGAFWEDGAFYFTTGEGTRKARNLANDPRCNITLSGNGLDLVVEGRAEKVKDQATLERLAEIAREGGWPATVKDGALTAPFSAPSAGPPPWELYRVRPTTIYGLGTSAPYGATRWRF